MRLYQNFVALGLIAVFLVVFAVVVMPDITNSSDDSSMISGNVVNTHVELIPAAAKNCSFHLNPGWNMVSFFCLGMFLDRNVALDSISGSYGSIFQYNPTDASDPWKSYNPYIPGWTVQQLNHMDRISGYWIYMFNDADYHYAGIYSDSVIYFSNGWNLIGYPLNYSSNISAQLIGKQYLIVKYYDNPSDTWLSYVNGSPSNTLKRFDTYKGYWVNVNGSSQWNIYRG